MQFDCRNSWDPLAGSIQHLGNDTGYDLLLSFQIDVGRLRTPAGSPRPVTCATIVLEQYACTHGASSSMLYTWYKVPSYNRFPHTTPPSYALFCCAPCLGRLPRNVCSKQATTLFAFGWSQAPAPTYLVLLQTWLALCVVVEG